MKDTEARICEGLGFCSKEMQGLAQELRVYLGELTNPAYELAGKSAQSFNIGYGYTTTSWDCFCAIIVYRRHINLSFPSGASLSDPDGLLHGSGVRVRHLKMTSLDDLKTPAARELILRARDQALFLLEGGKPGHEGLITVMKTKGS